MVSWDSQGAPRADQSGSYNPIDDLALFGPRRSYAALVVIVALLAGAGTSATLSYLGGRAPAKAVPALVGYSVEYARKMARKLGLGLLVAGERPDPLVAKGSIALQDPLARQPLREGRAIVVVLSTGKPRSLSSGAAGAPGAAGARRSRPSDVTPPPDPAAQAAALAAGRLVKGPQKLSWSEEVKKGAKPAAAAPAAAGPLVTVPRVIKTRLRYARTKLKSAGLRVGSVRHKTDEDHMAGMVLSQRPSAGAKVPKGSAVTLVVNRYED